MPGWIPWFILLVALASSLWFHLLWRRRSASLEREIARRGQELTQLRHGREQVSAENLARHESLFDHVVEGVLILDAHKRIQLANRAFSNLAGVTGPVLGKTVLEALRRHELAELIERLEKKGESLPFELELSHPALRHLEVTGATIASPNRRLQGFILIFHDVTRMKQLENVRAEFVANVSHELRTPLSMIKGYVETLLDGAAENPEFRTKFLKVIERHTDRLEFLIEDLLTIAKLESGQVALNLQALDLRRLAGRVFEDLRARAQDRKVTLQNEVAEPTIVKADPERLEQVLWNLIDNAIKYGKPGGSVQVASARAPEPGLIQVSVHDDGPGIPPESQPRIFERFYRVDRARARQQGGTGLGLSIVKHIVLAHGGRVWLESRPGTGATFWFTIPAAEGNAESEVNSNF